YKRFFAAMTAGAAPFYLNFSAAEVETASLEAALAVHAYSSTSSAVPPRLVAGTTYYGLKPLPFIRQVYLQWAYEDRKTEPEDEDPYTHWMRLDNSVAMAIELGNPFDERIDLANADRPVQIRVVFQGNPVSAVEVSSGTFEADGQFLPPRPAVGEPNSPVIVYSNGQQSLTGTDGRGANIVTDLNLGGQGRVRLPSGSLTIPLSSPAFPNSGPLPLQDVVIELRTRASAAAPWVTYDRFHLRSTSAPGTPVITDNADNDPVPDAISHAEWPEASHRHAQVSFARSGSNWRYLSNRGRDVTMARQPPPAGDEGFSTDASLVVDEKSRQGGGAIQGDTELDSRPINIAGRPIYSLGELGWIFMVGFTSQDTGDLPQRLSGVDGTGGFLSTPEGRRRLFLDVSSNAALTEIPGVGRVPHAAIIMDLFTTLHPGFDGVDNDGDGAVDGMVADANTNEPLPREQLIRGTINVNTAPPEVLAMVLPLPEGFATTQALIDQIVQYRENPGQRQAITGFGQTVRADRPGIASIGELLFINPAASGNPANMQRYGRGLALPPNVPMNLYPMDENADKTAYDGTGDTPEERMARFQMISQVLSTRTDFFAAWVQVRGYRAGRWDEGPVESARFLAIFDRSEVRNPDDTVRVLGVFRID
ncbi:MAG: hypothetical protein JJU36_10390, partial [Phycisphaeraceae bacterium]|nr:hypothetical protein [Phycisphaeraceae bacterium]